MSSNKKHSKLESGARETHRNIYNFRIIARSFENKRIRIAFYLFLLTTFPIHAFAQENTIDTKDISFNVTSYLFSYDTKFKNGSLAVGPTVSLNTNGKLTIQLGLLYDFRKYNYYVKRIDYSSGYIYFVPVEDINLFIPLSLQYNYYTSDKVTLFLTAGCMFGGRNTLNENEVAIKTSNIHLTGGVGGILLSSKVVSSQDVSNDKI